MATFGWLIVKIRNVVNVSSVYVQTVFIDDYSSYSRFILTLCLSNTRKCYYFLVYLKRFYRNSHLLCLKSKEYNIYFTNRYHNFKISEINQVIVLLCLVSKRNVKIIYEKNYIKDKERSLMLLHYFIF